MLICLNLSVAQQFSIGIKAYKLFASGGVRCEYLSNPGIEPGSSALKADSLPFELQGRPTNYLLCDNLECVLGKQHKLVN